VLIKNGVVNAMLDLFKGEFKDAFNQKQIHFLSFVDTNLFV